ncbi:MAG: SpoIIE family protein phosphatase [Candidatus Omnitrophica bacterium]|nr:SpoIIE family protein phosphatase [Candidatus Omnitrophota bacterium]
MRKMKLRTSMILWIWAVAAAIFLAILWVDFITTKESVEDEIEKDAIDLARYYSKRVDEILAEIVSATRVMAKQMEIQYKTGDIDRPETLELYIKNIVDTNPFIDCTVIGFEPYAYDANTMKYAPYYYKNNYRFNEEDYNYFEREWYKGPKKSGTPVWTEPYYAYDTNIMMVTYSEPFFKDGDFMGAVGLDLTLERLRNEIADLKLLETGYGFVLSKDGFLISYPDKTKGFGNNISELSADLAKEIDKLVTLKPEEWILLKMKDPLRKEKSWIVLRPLRTHSNRLLEVKTIMGSVGFVYPEKEILSLIYTLQRKAIYTAIIGLIVLLIIIITISNAIAGPITRLAEGVMKVSKGDLDHKLSAKAKFLEVEELQIAFNKMSEDLKTYIKNLKEAIGTRERIESELRIAHNIQMGILPKIFPPFPDSPEFDIYAVLKSAKEVGGDFYDFFFVDDDRLCFLIADVSDKGVPASLLMAVTKTMIKMMSKDSKGPDEILGKVNKEISRDNDSCMFITIFCGILNIKTGEVLYSNGGHPPPAVIRSNGEVKFLEGGAGAAIGISEETVYKSASMRLEPGDALCMYTDGVTEASNKKQQFFGQERLKQGISATVHKPIRGIVAEICSRVDEFSKDMPQSDDIAVLAIKYFGEHNISTEKTVTLKNDVSEIRRLKESVRIFAESGKWPEEIISKIILALEEILANIQKYAYADKAEHRITVILAYGDSNFTAKVIDDGRPFNPLEIGQPDTSAPIETRNEGGLGIFLARNIMDSMEYHRENDKNILSLKKIIRGS